MKACRNCASPNDDDASFCENCGEKLIKSGNGTPQTQSAPGNGPQGFCTIAAPVKQMQDLARRVMKEVVEPLRKAIAAADSQLKSDQDRANAELKACIARADAADKKELETAHSALKEADSRLDGLEKAALDKIQRAKASVSSLELRVSSLEGAFKKHKMNIGAGFTLWFLLYIVIAVVSVLILGPPKASDWRGTAAWSMTAATVLIFVLPWLENKLRYEIKVRAPRRNLKLDVKEAEVRLRKLQKRHESSVKAHEGIRGRNQEIHRIAIAAAKGRYKQTVSAGETRHNQAMDLAFGRKSEALSRCFKKYIPGVQQYHQAFGEFEADLGFTGIGWEDPGWQRWTSAPSACPAVRVGTVRLEISDLSSLIPDNQHEFELPALLPFPGEKCLLFEATGEDKDISMEVVQSIMLRLLATIPPGKLRFTLIDPVGLGQNVAAFMGLGDYDEQLVSGKAWTEPQQIEQRLADITEHMETVIQKYLRNEFATIEKYNELAGEVAEPYRLLIALDFPVNFSDNAVRRLVSIAKNGPRCGVYGIIVRDTSKSLPYGFTLDDLHQEAVVIGKGKDRFVWGDDEEFLTWLLKLDGPPPSGLIQKVIKGVGEKAKEGAKVEVPFDKLLQLAELREPSWWKRDTIRCLEGPLGQAGARKVQSLRFGEGTSHHALIVGRTGSGKTNLMHVLINSLALAYPPEELELYLVDFKQGVAFKPYADLPLPHARVIAIESEREFGLSVLQGLDAEMMRRGEEFRKVGVEDITGFREKLGALGRIPRKLLLVDEFQEFFSHEDSMGREAARILDHLARQGRSHGIHVVLGSQTLTGSSDLAKSTKEQFGVRIALQCSEADSRLILADDNPAARLLSRPGEAIYNDASGLVEGNKLFQVARWDNSDKEHFLATVKSRFRDRVDSSPIVFEGNEAAQLEECAPLRKILVGRQANVQLKIGEAWLGEPIAIKPPTVARFRRQTGSHLLIVMRDEEEAIGMLSATFLSLLPQDPRCKHLIVDLTTAESDWSTLSDKFAGMSVSGIEVVRRRGLKSVVRRILAEVQQRIASDSRGGPKLYLMIWGLHRARDLRDDDLSNAAYSASEPSLQDAFATILREGPELGVHIIAWCDTVSNADRFLRGRLIGEFNMRVAGPMNINDSHTLLDDPAASKLAKPHRALFFDEDQPGRLEKFRPYGVPSREFRERIALTAIERLPTA